MAGRSVAGGARRSMSSAHRCWHADAIHCPVIPFQVFKDTVVADAQPPRRWPWHWSNKRRAGGGARFSEEGQMASAVLPVARWKVLKGTEAFLSPPLSPVSGFLQAWLGPASGFGWFVLITQSTLVILPDHRAPDRQPAGHEALGPAEALSPVRWALNRGAPTARCPCFPLR